MLIEGIDGQGSKRKELGHGICQRKMEDMMQDL